MYKPTDVADYINHHSQWKIALEQLRKLVLEAGYTETIKWNAPTYTLGGKNLISLAAFKEHCGLWFHRGSLLSDVLQVLNNAQEGKTVGMRHWKFYNDGDALHNVEALPLHSIRQYLEETAEQFHAGLDVVHPKKPSSPVVVPDELDELLQQEELLAAWDQLSSAKQREYCTYIAEAKRASTKQSRLDKIKPLIAAGKGIAALYAKG